MARGDDTHGGLGRLGPFPSVARRILAVAALPILAAFLISTLLELRDNDPKGEEQYKEFVKVSSTQAVRSAALGEAINPGTPGAMTFYFVGTTPEGFAGFTTRPTERDGFTPDTLYYRLRTKPKMHGVFTLSGTSTRVKVIEATETTLRYVMP